MNIVVRKPRWQSSCPHSDPSRTQKSYFPPEPRTMKDRGYLLVEPDQYFPNQFNNYNLQSRHYFPGPVVDDWSRDSGRLEETFYIEMAIFIDHELFKIMQENFPVDTEEHIIQVVLAMINAVKFYWLANVHNSKCSSLFQVQLLYNDETLGVDVQFLIKRLEILQTDPPELQRSYNIDRYLASFCKVKKREWEKQNRYYFSFEFKDDTKLIANSKKNTLQQHCAMQT